jgi:hypothetical protein
MRLLTLDISKRSTGWAWYDVERAVKLAAAHAALPDDGSCCDDTCGPDCRCLCHQDWVPASSTMHGVWDRLGSEFTTRGQLYYALYKALTDHVQLMPVDKIYAEEPVNLIPNGVATTAENIWISVGMAATVELFAHTRGIRLTWVHQARWRREFLGKMPRGTKSPDLKALAVERARQLGFKPQRHDDAEAIGILDYACKVEHMPAPWRADEVLRPMLTGARR